MVYCYSSWNRLHREYKWIAICWSFLGLPLDVYMYILSYESASTSVVSFSLWPMDCSPPRSCFHGILQARILEWVAMLSSSRSSQTKEWTSVSCIASRFFTVWATRVYIYIYMHYTCRMWFIYAVYVGIYHQNLSVDLQVKFNFCFSYILKVNK